MFEMLSKGSVVVFGALLIQSLKFSSCYSQQNQPDTTFLSQAHKKSIARYSQAIQHQSRLFNGTDYVVYISKEEEHPYFKIDDWVFGSVVYWGEPYDNVSLMYDLSTDQLIAEHEGGNPIKLIEEKVERFSISDHAFVRLKKDRDNTISEGFYNELYGGHVKVYAKYHKRYQETISGHTITPRFDENTRYYIFRNGSYHSVRNKRSVLEVFADRKQAVKEFIRKNHIRFKNNREEAMVRIAEFYDTSTQ